ncbi:Hypothetical predicted protein [Mytilus galloprovincialis]|uniref:DZIP3-like HEPN domain-containing protein n=1 Tax=Mytilus galloprovincialis TaxID=29158 RepID=A0A8B6BPV5_MYTGA|nr:Hypothetical predicted protein [Mytilus galloprovincialis]
MDKEDQRRCFVVGSVFMEIVAPLFRQKLVNDYTTKGLGSIQAFINSQSVIHTLFHLRHRNSHCCQDQVNCYNSPALPVNYSQWDLLYSENPGPGPHNCHCKFTANQIQLDDLDITLASLILLNCCNLGLQEENVVRKLRQYKNDYLSHNTKGQITETEYHTLWNDLESFIQQLDPSKEDDLIRIEQRPLDQPLCDKYLTCLLDLYKKLDEMDTKLDHQTELLQEMNDILRNQKSLFIRGLSSLLKLLKSKQLPDQRPKLEESDQPAQPKLEESDQPAQPKLEESDQPAQPKLGQFLFTLNQQIDLTLVVGVDWNTLNQTKKLYSRGNNNLTEPFIPSFVQTIFKRKKGTKDIYWRLIPKVVLNGENKWNEILELNELECREILKLFLLITQNYNGYSLE